MNLLGVNTNSDPYTAFFWKSVWYGPIEESKSILAANSDLMGRDIFMTAILGDEEGTRKFLDADKSLARTKGGPLGWDPLTYLGFSKYLRLEPARSDGFIQTAKALLEAGADPNSGFVDEVHQPSPERESILYGVAGVAFHAGLTKLLLDWGADPNDNEVPYHSIEGPNNDAVRVLIDSGKLNAESLGMMLLRKTDVHDYEGLDLLLKAGADPNRMTRWHHTALHHGVKRDNDLRNIELLLDHGADPMLGNRADGRSAIAMAAWRGRADVLKSLAKRGISLQLEGLDQLLVACALDDGKEIEAIKRNEPGVLKELIQYGGTLLAVYAGNNNTSGMARLLELGVGVDERFFEGDGYFEIAPNSTALQVAAWRAAHDAVQFLIERGADVNAKDGRGRTPLELAVKACVDSYWTAGRKPLSVEYLLKAGALPHIPNYPSGYEEVDDLIRARI